MTSCLAGLVISASVPMVAWAQVQSLCEFEKPLSQSYSEAATAELQAVDTPRHNKSIQQVIATAVIAWGEEGIKPTQRTRGKHKGIFDYKRTERGVTACYYSDEFCAIPTNLVLGGKLRAHFKARTWDASLIPVYATTESVRWAERVLGCDESTELIRFKDGAWLDKPIAYFENGGHTVASALPPKAPDHARQCHSLNQASCRILYSRSKQLYDSAKTPEKRDYHATFAKYWAKRGCSGGGQDMCGVETQFYSPKKAIAEATGKPTERTPDGKAWIIPDSAARYMRSDLVRMGRAGNRYSAERKASDGCYRYHSTTGKFCFTAGWMAEHGYDSRPDPKQARAHYSKACDQGSNAGCERFAEMSYNGKGGDPDYYSGSSVAARLCKSGDAQACYNYHLGAVNSISVASPARIEASAEFFQYHCRKAQPSAPSCYNLAFLMESPLGYNRRVEAMRLYSRSCSLKNGVKAGCEAKASLERLVANQRRQQQRAWERENASRGIGGFLSDLGSGINQATSMPGALSHPQSQRPQPTRAQSLAANPAISRQDWVDFENAINATDNIGSAYNSNCPASNPYC